MQTPEPNIPAAIATPPASKRPLWPKLFTAIVLLGVAALAVSLLPRGYSQDISLIGKGDNIVVLFHDPFLVNSQENMDTVNTVRDEYKGRVKFIVADKNVEQGKKFTKLYGVDSPVLVFFAPGGEKIHILDTRQDRESLRKNINQVFNF